MKAQSKKSSDPDFCKLGKGWSIALSGDRTVACFPVTNHKGDYLWVLDRPGEGALRISTRMRVSGEAFAAMGAIVVTAMKPITEMALASGQENKV